MKIIYLYFILIPIVWLHCVSAWAQASLSDPNLPKLIPPSPNAASLGIYGDIPVSKYTGVPSIEVPLYTLKVGSLSLPISLNYHASGIKVAQEASWVGLGWSLDAGGVISRSVVGVEDFDSFNRGYARNSTYPPCTNGYCDMSNTSWKADRSDWTDVQQGRQDTGPDQFYYNLAGYSGKMVYSPKKKEFVSLKANNLRITYNSSAGRWVLLTPDGTRYVFGTEEKTVSYQQNEQGEVPNVSDLTNRSGTPPITTSWYLDSVVAPTKEYIAFRYSTVNYATPSVVYQSRSFRWLNQFWENVCGMSGTPDGTADNNGVVTRIKVNEQVASFAYNQSVVQDKYLLEINTSTGVTVSFITSDRQDLKLSPYASIARPQKLTKISISSTGTQQTIEHLLSYSYFPSVSHPASEDYKYLRLRLDQVSTKSNGPTRPALENPPYVFTYNNGVLPAKNSLNIDHWGYYNYSYTNNDICTSGWVNSTSPGHGTLIPPYRVTVNGVSTLTISGADRNPNPGTVQYGMLTGITYPTGGGTAFEYEINGYHGGWVDSTSSTHYATVTGSTPATAAQPSDFSTRFTVPGGRLFLSTYSYPIPGGNPAAPTYTTDCVHIPNPSGPLTKVYRGTSYIQSDPLLCEIIPYGRSSGSERFLYNQWDLPCDAENNTLVKKYVTTVGDNLNTPAPNTYTLHLRPAPGFLGVAIATTEATTPVYRENPAGGVRIRKIVSSSGQQTLTKTYRYTERLNSSSTSPIVSSGLLLAPISYFYTAIPGTSMEQSIAFILSSNTLSENNMLIANSSSCLPMAISGSGSSVGYSQVTETISTQGTEGGKIVETYVNEAEARGGFGSNPYLFPGMPYPPKNGNGLVKQVSTYAADGALINTTTNRYKSSIDTTATARLYIPYGHLPQSACSVPMFMRCYDYTVEWWRKVADSTATYSTDHGNHNFLCNINKYSYDITNKLVNEQTTRTSTGEQLTTKTSFAHNTPSETQTLPATMVALRSHYMIGLPLKQETFRDTRRVNAKVTNYSAQLLPASVQVLEGSQLPVRAVYDNYDERGNLTQYHVPHGASVSVVWGYQNAQPVIQAQNATYSELTVAVEQALLDMGYAGGLTSLNSFLSSIAELSTDAQQRIRLQLFAGKVRGHASLHQAQITVYTYHPLFGRLSTIDIQGRMQYAEYDDLGRLVRTRDEQGRILSQQQYHYAGK